MMLDLKGGAPPRENKNSSAGAACPFWLAAAKAKKLGYRTAPRMQRGSRRGEHSTCTVVTASAL